MGHGVLAYHHLSLSVTDLSRSEQWYQSVLGLETVAEIERENFRRIRLRDPGSGVTLTLTAHREQSNAPFDERSAGMDHVAFLVDNGSMRAFKERLEQLNIDHSPIKTSSGGGVTITFRDPDNIQLELFADS